MKSKRAICFKKVKKRGAVVFSARKMGKQCPWIAIRLPALLVEGVPQAPMNAEFHSAAARPMDASVHAQLTADRGLFLFMWIMKSRKIEAECGP